MLTIVIFVLGVITVILSVLVAVIFRRKAALMTAPESRRLTMALHWQLVGEATIGLGTLIFAAAAVMGWLPNWSVGLQSAIRFAMFFATAATTIHLALVVHKQ